ncbi:Homeobox-leucine zipper protein HAT3 [Bienertia sinuspersici]
MEDEDKHEFWGLSLSLKPPITYLDDDNKIICKRESQFSLDEQSPKMQKHNKPLMMMPRINNNDQQKQLVVIDLEEVEIAGKVGSPNSTLSSATTAKKMGGFGGEREMISDDDEEGGGSGGRFGGRKKLRLTKEQIVVLEQAFGEHTTLNTKQKVALAKQVNLRPRQVEVWFQNRRARTKLKQTEVDCEQLRRFCETLTEENRKLQNEVQELRALKASPANQPSTSFTMCPSCKSVSLSATTKPPTGEMARCPMGVFHRAVPLNLNQLSLTINNNSISNNNYGVITK